MALANVSVGGVRVVEVTDGSLVERNPPDPPSSPA